MGGQFVEFHDRGGIQRRRFADAAEFRFRWSTASVDEDFVGAELTRAAVVQLNFDLVRPDEPRVTGDQIKIRSLLNSLEAALAKLFDHTLLALADFAHVDDDFAMMHAIVRCATREISHAGAIEHRLCRRAAIVDAGAADVGALDQRGLPTGFSERYGERVTRLT